MKGIIYYFGLGKTNRRKLYNHQMGILDLYHDSEN